MTTSNDIITFRSLLPEHHIGMLTTQTPAGELHSRPVTVQEMDDDGHLWFIVSADASWVQGLRADEPLNLSFTDDDERTWVSVAGTARLTENAARLQRYRAAGGSDVGGRIDDVDARLLDVTPSTVEYWDAPSGRLQALVLRAASVIGRGDAGGSSGRLDIG